MTRPRRAGRRSLLTGPLESVAAAAFSSVWLAQRLRELAGPLRGMRLCIAFSGGADSTALLAALACAAYPPSLRAARRCTSITTCSLAPAASRARRAPARDAWACPAGSWMRRCASRAASRRRQRRATVRYAALRAALRAGRVAAARPAPGRSGGVAPAAAAARRRRGRARGDAGAGRDLCCARCWP